MAGEWVRRKTRAFFEAVARFLQRIGISANFLTFLGFLLNLIVAYLLARGSFWPGGLLLILGGILDRLDGAVARLNGSTSRFGAFLDSTVDRFSEAVVYLGLMVFYVHRGARQESLLIYVAIVGSLMVSYARARAEGLGIECREGLLTRFERLFILVCGLFLNQMLIALWILAVLSNFTALQRTYLVWKATREGSQRATSPSTDPGETSEVQ